MRAPALLTPLLVASLLTACGTTDDAAGGAQDDPDGCPQVLVVGIRGQSQSLDHHRGLGTEVDGVVALLQRDLAEEDSGDVEVDAIRHRSRDASSLEVYDADVAQGSTLLAERLTEAAGACPDVDVAIVGFSQGAQIAHETLAARPDLAADVDALALLGSPRHDPDAPVEHLALPGGDANRPGSLGPGPDLGDLAGRTVEACLVGDVVCAHDGGTDLTIHKHGYEHSDVARVVARGLLPMLD